MTSIKNKTLKVIFVDVDGVLNTLFTHPQHGSYFDDVLVGRLREIVRRTGCKIVISSSWRRFAENRAVLFAKLEEFGLQQHVIGDTPVLVSSVGSPKRPRALEIEAWLKDRPDVLRYAVIDDDETAGLLRIGKNYFRTIGYEGLSIAVASAVIRHLNGEALSLPWCERCASYHAEPLDREHHELLKCRNPWKEGRRHEDPARTN